jgi:hypothetical protein
MKLNRREALVTAAAMLAIRPHQFPFRIDDVEGCSRVYYRGVERSRYYANLRSGRQIEITESQFNEIWRRRHELQST